MRNKPIIIVAGEPNSIFLEIFFKSQKKLKIKSPTILICSLKLLNMQMKKLNYIKKIRVLDKKNMSFTNLDNKSINLIDVNYNPKRAFEKISSNSNKYINECFEIVNHKKKLKR